MTESNGNLNFALVRLEGVPGREPIGGERAEPGAPPRGWISIDPEKALQASRPDRVLILHYPAGESLKLVLSTSDSIGMNDQGTRISYKLEADSVATGAPCFNSKWELVGLHGGPLPNSPSESYGITASAVIAALQRSGFDLFGARDKFEATVLRGGRVFLNRAFLRQALREMVRPDGKRILVVNGPRGSGKTYTREYILDVTYSTPNHRVIYIDLDTGDFGPYELTQIIALQIGSTSGQIPIPDNEQTARWIRRLCNYLIGEMIRNTTIKWWLILDGFSRAVRPETHDFIMELALRSESVDLRFVLLNYEIRLPLRLDARAIIEKIAPIGRGDVEAFIFQQLQQRDPAISQETVNTIVDKVLTASEESLAKEMYPTPDRLRVLNRMIKAFIPE